jgi:hypothetical protein
MVTLAQVVATYLNMSILVVLNLRKAQLTMVEGLGEQMLTQLVFLPLVDMMA